MESGPAGCGVSEPIVGVIRSLRGWLDLRSLWVANSVDLVWLVGVRLTCGNASEAGGVDPG